MYSDGRLTHRLTGFLIEKQKDCLWFWSGQKHKQNSSEIKSQESMSLFFFILTHFYGVFSIILVLDIYLWT